MQTYPIPSTGYLRLKDIIGDRKQQIPAIIPLGRTTWLEGVKSGIYPSPITLGERCIAWRVEDILDLISALDTTSNG
jgi:predicted DNA-binding transcriptional regulator AlpA